MKKELNRSFLGAAPLAVSLLLQAQGSYAQEFKYTIDPSHSNIGFETKHMVISKVAGYFKDVEGTIVFDADKPEASKINAKVKSASINTNDAKRDEHLKSPDFFDATKYPTLEFVSTGVVPNGDKKYKMNGNLTMRGVTKPVTFDVDFLGETTDPWGSHRAGFEATTKVNRQDFGIKWNKDLDKGGVMVSNDVIIKLNIEAVEAKVDAGKKK